VQVCDPNNSCPVNPTSCDFVTCSFQAPATPGTYQLLVNDPSTGAILQPPFEVVGSGGNLSCPASG
jgi:hypothetical protein